MENRRSGLLVAFAGKNALGTLKIGAAHAARAGYGIFAGVAPAALNAEFAARVVGGRAGGGAGPVAFDQVVVVCAFIAFRVQRARALDAHCRAILASAGGYVLVLSAEAVSCALIVLGRIISVV